MVILALPAALAAPLAPAVVKYDRGHESLNIPFEMNSNKIYLPVRVNGSGPYWFVLDSGAPQTEIDMPLGKRLGLPLGETGQTTGAGSESRAIGRTSFNEIELPGMSYKPENPFLLDVNAAMRPAEGRDVQGLLGGDLLRSTVVEIDYAKKLVSFRDPASYHHVSKGFTVPIKVQGWMFAEATIDMGSGSAVKGSFLVDIGDRLALTMNTPFVNENHLLTPSMPRWPVGSGLGGLITHGIARVASMKMGDATISRPIATLSQDQAGAFSQSGFQGIIGAEMLKGFKVTIDYPDSKLYLDPVDPGREQDFDCSGMFLNATGEKLRSFKVLAVGEKSPAAQTGIRAGDLILMLDGKPAGEFSLEEIRSKLRQNGKDLAVRYARSGIRHDVTIHLKLPA